jgi:hypothetical protein
MSILSILNNIKQYISNVITDTIYTIILTNKSITVLFSGSLDNKTSLRKIAFIEINKYISNAVN